jgi:hypothetical protein
MILRFRFLLKLARAAPFDRAYRSVFAQPHYLAARMSYDWGVIQYPILFCILMLLRRILNAFPCSLALSIISLCKSVSIKSRLAKALHLLKIIRVQ